jgi:hypothetical protein
VVYPSLELPESFNGEKVQEKAFSFLILSLFALHDVRLRYEEANRFI